MTDNLPAKVPGTAQQFQKYLFSDDMKNKFQMAVPKWLSVDRLLRIVFSSVLKTPKLLQCTTESLMNAVMQCAQLGLEPILGRAYLIPYKNNKKPGKPLECEFQPGYQGLVDLAERSGKIETVKAHVVYENDEFEIEYGLDERLIHKPKMDGNRGKPIGSYTVWTRKTGVKTYTFMLLADIYRDFRSKSVAYNYAIRDKRTDTPWIENEPEMLKKSLVKRHSKLEPASVDFMEAVEIDNMADIGQSSGLALLNGLDPAVSLDEKLKATAKVHAGEDIYNPKEREPEKEKKEEEKQPYETMGKREFKKFCKGERNLVPGMDSYHQAKIRSIWDKDFPSETFPVPDKAEPPPEDAVPLEQQMLKLVEGSKMDTNGLVVPCPDTGGQGIFRAKCDGIGLDACKSREGCPTWENWDNR